MTERTIAAPALAQRGFVPLAQADFQALEHAASLKGLLKPFKGKGSLEDWASQCTQLRDGLIGLGVRRVLAQARAYPFSLLGIQLAQQTTSAGTTFLRWRNLDRSAMGVALWRNLVASTATPERLIDDLFLMEQQRITLNMQISLTHSIARQASDCASAMASAEEVYVRRRPGDGGSLPPPRSPHPHQEVP